MRRENSDFAVHYLSVEHTQAAFWYKMSQKYAELHNTGRRIKNSIKKN